MTTQVKDKCKYLGGEYLMPVLLGFPVENSQVKELGLSELGSSDSSGLYLSTACWRNYLATWEVKDDKLYLVELEGKYKLVGNKPLHASWFTGAFELPQGDLVDCIVEPEFQLKYTKTVELIFESGVLVKSNNRSAE